MDPKWFWIVQIILVEYQSFWTCPIRFGQVQIIKISQEKSNLNLTKMIFTWPKRFWPDQNNLDGPKSFWFYRRTKHKFLSTWTVIGDQILIFKIVFGAA